MSNILEFQRDIVQVMFSDRWEIYLCSGYGPDQVYAITYKFEGSAADLAAGKDLYKVLGEGLREAFENTHYIKDMKNSYENEIMDLKKEIDELKDYKTHFDKEKELRK